MKLLAKGFFGTAVLFLLGWPASYAQPIPRNVAIDINRNLISPKSFSFTNSEITLSLEGVSATDAVTAKARSLGDLDQIIKDLSTLAGWPSFAAFQSYFLSLPGRYEMIPQAKAAVDLTKDGTARFVLWPLNTSTRPIDPELTKLTVHYEKSLITGTNAFVLHPGKVGYDPDNAIFFRLSGLEADVPEVVFWTAQSAFVNGLVTRLVLDRFEDVLNKVSPNSHAVPSLPKPIFQFPRDGFEKPPGGWGNDQPIEQVIQRVLKQNPIQGDALLYGWYAGDALAKSDDKFKAAAWSLLQRSYDVRRIGQMVGYTLSYLEGYAQNLQYGRPVGTAVQEQTILDNLAAISIQAGNETALRSTVRQQDGVPPAAWLNETLFTAVTNEQYNTAVGSAPDRLKNLARFKTFLQGFNQGSIRAANVVYADTFLLAYGIGYADGFNDGYAKGYSEGYRAGYAQGGADAQRSFFGDLGNFLDDVGKVVGIAAEIISWF
jgi:hypothetical protein